MPNQRKQKTRTRAHSNTRTHLEHVGVLEAEEFDQLPGSSLQDMLFVDVVVESPIRVAAIEVSLDFATLALAEAPFRRVGQSVGREIRQCPHLVLTEKRMERKRT